ncbi:hypothetical protein ES705_43577 [subsurface metagenome]
MLTLQAWTRLSKSVIISNIVMSTAAAHILSWVVWIADSTLQFHLNYQQEGVFVLIFFHTPHTLHTTILFRATIIFVHLMATGMLMAMIHGVK